jgi:methylenetetrahydrofolate dehydrogenase (NADP+) / methenyltetrahydrofolate cyclohydrolase
MTARILDGRRIARAVRDDLMAMAARDEARFGMPAGLAIVRVGQDPSSQVYTRALLRASEHVGVRATTVSLPDEIDETGLRACIEVLNADTSIHGILMQLPLPKHLSQRLVAETIDPRKDVDGISTRSAGDLFLRLPTFVPSTCAAVLEILDRSEIRLNGERVVVVGASNVVGKPLAFLLLHRDATVTVCHIFTRDLAEQTRQASVVIVAAGKPRLLTAMMVQPGATVIDVGINVQPDGSLIGDVDAEGVMAVAGALSLVPGGVGQLTNLMLLKQTLLARQRLFGGEPAT